MKMQSGYGLLFLLLISSVGYVLFFPPSNTQTHASIDNIAKLKYAKKILLAYAQSFPFTESSGKNSRAGLPPMLPCPSLQNVRSDGTEKGSCGKLNVASIGLFPWKSLQTQPLFSAQGECIWYLVSGNIKRNNIQTKTHSNLDSDQWIKFHNQYGVAALLAPKESQSRKSKTAAFRCRQSYDPNAVFSLHSSASFDTQHTDVIIDLSNQHAFDVQLISRVELLSQYTQSATYKELINSLGKTLAQCVASISTFSSTNLTWKLPFAANISLIDDRRRDAYQAKNNLYSGRFPYKFATTNLKSLCSSLFIHSSQYTNKNAFETSPLFRVWMHSKNFWFLKTLANCQPDGKQCLTTSTDSFFAMIVYAGKVSKNQSRKSYRQGYKDRDDIANYLEGNTLDIFQNRTQTLSLRSNSNDQRFCINTRKQIKSC